MNRTTHIAMAAASVAVLSSLAALGALSAQGAPPEENWEFGENDIYIELNDTDHDLGIHASIDADPWTLMTIISPNRQKILETKPQKTLSQQGLTQLFWESAEPKFDELAPSAFLTRFPEGIYRIIARTEDGATKEAQAVFSHRLAAPPANIRVNGLPAAACDTPQVPVVDSPVTITWDPVTQSHPTIGPKGPVTVVRYQVFAEQRIHNPLKYNLDLPADQHRYVVAPELIAVGDREYKFEIQVRTSDRNQTAIENCFKMK